MPSTHARTPRGVISSFNFNIVHVRNPNVIMWWSATFPGFGHMLLCKYWTAMMLIIWEFIVNLNAHLNLAILDTFLGDFDAAEAVLNKRWLLLYVPPYLFGLWDTRRLVYDLNKFAVMAELNHASIDRIKITALEVNQTTKRHPSLAVFWSSMMPGLGHLYVNRLPDGFFIIIVWVVCCYFSNLLPALHATWTGDFAGAVRVVNPDWLLFTPSLYVYTIYDSYVNCVEINREFHIEQTKFLRANYQDKKFLSYTHLFTSGVNQMNIVASFEQTSTIELALQELQRNGIPREGILTIPLSDKEKPQKLQHIMANNGFYALNTSLCLGSATMTLGVIYGFRWTGGPILWGLISLLVGAILGYLFELTFHLAKLQLVKKRNKGPDVIVVVYAKKSQVAMVKEVLFEYNALSMSELEFES